MSHDSVGLSEKLTPISSIVENFRGARMDLDHFVGEMLDRGENERRCHLEEQSRAADRLQMLERQLEETRELLEQQKASRKSGSETNEQLQDEVDDLQRQVLEFSHESTRQEDALGELTVERDALRETYDQKTAEVEKLREQLAVAAEVDASEADARIGTLNQQNEELQSELETLRDQLTRLNGESSEHSGMIETLTSERDALRETYDQKTAEVEKLREQLAVAAEVDASEADARIGTLNQQNEELQSELETLRDQLTQLSGESSEHSGMIETLTSERDTLRESHDHATADVEKLREQLAVAAEVDTSEADAHIDTLNQQNEELQSELETLRDRAVELNSRVRETQRKAAEERAEWTTELRQMRRALERQPAVQAPVEPEPLVAASVAPVAPVALATPADAVLSNVMAQFELVQKDAQRHRTAG